MVVYRKEDRYIDIDIDLDACSRAGERIIKATVRSIV
jgi:hypothetical protein